MNILPSMNSIDNIKLEDKGRVLIPGTSTYLKRLAIDMTAVFKSTDDILNAIACDEPRCRYMIIATEKGFIYFFNFDMNQFEGVIKTENWISSAIISRGYAFISTFGKNVHVFRIRSRTQVQTIKAAIPKREAFGPKGIIFINKKKDRQFIMNSGYTNFKICDVLTRKTVKIFQIYTPELNPENICKPTSIVMNFGANSKHNTLAFILKDSPQIQFYSLLSMKVFKSLRLYNPEELPDKMFLINTIIASCMDHFCIILQFAFNSEENTKVVSILVLIEISKNIDGQMDASTVLHHKLGILQVYIVNGGELFISHVFMPVLKAGITGDCDKGYIIGIGTRRGFSMVSVIDLRTNKVTQWTYWRKCEGRMYIM